MAEWTLDFHGEFPPSCTDCAVLADSGLGRAARGGDFAHDQDELSTDWRIGLAPEQHEDFTGIRCARDKTSFDEAR